jgi:hypothetical protein
MFVNDTRASAFSLVIANVVPLLGVVFLGWSLFAVMFLYWMENVVIGVLNVVRMTTVVGPVKEGINFRLNGKPYAAAMKGSLIVFFMMHYGIFTTVHGVFVFSLFGPLDVALATLIIGAVSLLISHVVSYFVNFIGHGEYKNVSAPELFFHPYKRVIVLHMVIISGGFAVQAFGAPILALILLVVIKSVVDLIIHMWEHRTLSMEKKPV